MNPTDSARPNRLAHEKSPYLLQHAHNPVDWFPWGEEAFEKARREDKPIFLSVGYSTCHWCHVMAHESFESEVIAEVMNRDFVNIKVDREERPDVDRVYMTFVQATTGSGGWPMSVWLTPELKPFVGGTYFPPDDRYGRPGFPNVLARIAGAWRENREGLEEQGTRIVAALQQSSWAEESEGGALNRETLAAAYRQIARSFDAHEGGFGGAPKFPRPVLLNFLFRIYAQAPNSDAGKQALEMNLFTLRKMAAGGMHDQLGGGFHRYSVDAYWHVPHFEKMLYDQAQLALAYLDAFQITREPLFEKVARDTLDYVRREMTSPEGGFYSAEDADSFFEHGKPEHGEGAFYIWTEQEINAALGESAALFCFRYGVESEGNAPAGSDPQGEFTGRNILLERHSLGATAERFGTSEAEAARVLEEARAALLAIRAKRPPPHLDDKIITAWNGLMISAFARAAQVLDDRDYLTCAERAAQFVREHLLDETRHELVRNFRGEASGVRGFADDYAFFIQALLDLYEASFEVSWLRLALQLQETQDRLFADQQAGGYFSVTGEDKSILLRLKEDHDGAEPSPNSVSALNLLRLAQLRADSELERRGRATIAAFAPQLARIPHAMPQMLVALDWSLAKPMQIVVAGEPGAEETRALLREIHRHFVPNKVLLLADAGEGQKFLAEKSVALAAMGMVNGRAGAYVCENFACQAPVTAPAELAQLLGRR